MNGDVVLLAHSSCRNLLLIDLIWLYRRPVESFFMSVEVPELSCVEPPDLSCVESPELSCVLVSDLSWVVVPGLPCVDVLVLSW